MIAEPLPRATVRSGGHPARESSRWFYATMAAASLATVFAGFARTFYLRSPGARSLAPLAIAHGIAFSAWVVLFLVQTLLVSTGRTRMHRKLGVGAAALAGVMTVSAPLLAIDAARRGALPGDPLAFLLVILVDVLCFAVFVGAGIYYRRHSDTHKRLMLLATTSLLPPAISRWPIAVGRPAVIVGVLVAFVAAVPLRDLWTRRRAVSISLWGGAILVLSGPLRLVLSQTVTWHRAASWLIR